jgi:hypothetical protein
VERLVGTLSEAEQDLVRETERRRLLDLGEDDLTQLHGRIRRARDKYVKQYRRQAAAKVPASGGRGKAFAKNTRARDKAEVFEEALARVSRRLGAVAHAAALELKAERLAEARQARNTSPPTPPARRRPAAMPDQVANRRPDTPDRRKRHATTRATGARRQARRDSR